MSRIRVAVLVAVTILSAAGPLRGQDAPAVPPSLAPSPTPSPLPSPSPSPSPGAAASSSIRGRVVTADRKPVAGAHVTVLELRKHADADGEGRFRFDVLPGVYLVQAEGPRGGISVGRVEVPAARAVEMEITLEHATHQETVVVTARAEAATVSDLAQPITVLAGADLTLHREATLGETVAQQPGVSSTYFGPGASRPVIRGLGGDRIRVLQEGVGTADASSTSPDHAVAYDPLSARQVEIVRGPATLLYGSSAVGGVVNVLDNRVPDRVAERRLSGVAELTGGTAADELMGGLSVGGGGGHLAWHLDGLARRTDDVRIPGFAESAALRAQEEDTGERHAQVGGVLENSATESAGGAVGGSWVGSRGFLGLALSVLESEYGVPGGHGHEDPGAAEEEEDVRIDMAQRRADVRGELRDPFAGFRAARVRIGLSDYEHRELEGTAVGTTFANQGLEGRLELSHHRWGAAAGTWGVQVARRDFESVGEEAFVPPTLTTSWAVFALEELGTGPVKFQLGGRFERQQVEARGDDPGTRTAHGVSGSAGLSWSHGEDFVAGLTFARTLKLPNAEELFANGPHVATRAFEVGHRDLVREKSLGVDLSLRGKAGRLSGQANVFLNRFADYIYQQFTGRERSGLAEVRYVQGDAEFWGAEGEATLELHHAEPHHLDVEVGGDFVRARLRDTGQDLPRIPPGRFHGALHYGSPSANARVEVRRVMEQDRTGPFELPTEGYTTLDAMVSYRLFAGERVLDFVLRGSNLADAEARNHVSFLKDVAPLPGRDVRLSVRVGF